jgi:hypothetical protein
VKEDEMGRTCSMNGERRNAYRILVGNPERKEDLDIDGRITLKWILERQDEVEWTGLIWLMIWTSGGPL